MCVYVCERQNERAYGFMMHVFTMCLRERGREGGRDLMFLSPLRPQSPGSPKAPLLFLSLRFVFSPHVCVSILPGVFCFRLEANVCVRVSEGKKNTESE